MTSFFHSILGAVAAITLAAPVAANDKPTAKDAVSEANSRIFVRFADGITTSQVQQINRRLGVTVVGKVLDGEILIVEVPYPETRQMILDAYARTKGVVYAEPDQVITIPKTFPSLDADSASDKHSAPGQGGPIRILPTE